MEKYLWIGFIGAVLALLFAAIQRKKVMSYSEGNATMQKIAQSIREGANAYLKHQYSTVAKVFAVVFVVLVIIAFASGGEMLSKFTPFAFLTGGIWSMLAGLIGMKIATNSISSARLTASSTARPRLPYPLIATLIFSMSYLFRCGGRSECSNRIMKWTSQLFDRNSGFHLSK